MTGAASESRLNKELKPSKQSEIRSTGGAGQWYDNCLRQVLIKKSRNSSMLSPRLYWMLIKGWGKRVVRNRVKTGAAQVLDGTVPESTGPDQRVQEYGAGYHLSG